MKVLVVVETAMVVEDVGAAKVLGTAPVKVAAASSARRAVVAKCRRRGLQQDDDDDDGVVVGVVATSPG